MFVSGIVCLYQFIGNRNAWLPVYLVLIYKSILIPLQEAYKCMYKTSDRSSPEVPIAQ